MPRSSPIVLSPDTTPEIQAKQLEIWRNLSAADRLEIISALSRSVEELALAGIRRRFPAATERECFLRLALLKLGPELTLAAYPEAAALIGR